jgi:hypothetical protein
MSTFTLKTEPVACFFAAFTREETIRTSSSTLILKHSLFILLLPPGLELTSSSKYDALPINYVQMLK